MKDVLLLPILFINLGHFVIFQIAKEADSGTLGSLVSWNAGALSYGLSYILVQQPLCLLSSIAWSLEPYSKGAFMVNFGVNIFRFEAYLFLALSVGIQFHKLSIAS